MRSTATSAVPALVLGPGVTALGVTRCLARRGTPVLSAGAGSDELLTRSRWYTPAPSRDGWDPGRSLGQNLRGLEVERAVIIPCTDALVMEAAGLPADLVDRFPSYQPPLDALRRVVDKGAFLTVLESADVDHPRTIMVDDATALDAMPALWGDRPIFIKPRDSQSFFREVGRKGIPVQDRRELEARVRELTAAGHGLILQEYVPGPASNHYFVDGFAVAPGEIVTHLVRRRLRMYPPDFGNSSLVVTVPPDEAADAVAALGRLFRAVGYRGIFSAEFKRDADDGVFRLLEVNARPWWYIEFTARAGVDVASLAYDMALGLDSAAPTGYEVGRKLVYPYYDLNACLHMYTSRTRALWRFIRDLLGADDALFSWDDPLPALHQSLQIVKRSVLSRLPGARRAAAA